MKFTWITHSCFKIRLESGLELLFDPFNNEIGYEPIDLTTDILFVSHQHFDHNYVECVKGDYVLMDKPGEYQVKDVKITGFPSVHDHHGGANRGDNIIFKIEAEGMSIMHMGDVGCIPTAEEFEAFGHVDVLMIPVGGFYTVDANEALEICKRINPNIILPMHYKTLYLEMPIAPVFEFTDAAGKYFDRSRLGANNFSITKDNLKKRTRIIVMNNSLDC